MRESIQFVCEAALAARQYFLSLLARENAVPIPARAVRKAAFSASSAPYPALGGSASPSHSPFSALSSAKYFPDSFLLETIGSVTLRHAPPTLHTDLRETLVPQTHDLLPLSEPYTTTPRPCAKNGATPVCFRTMQEDSVPPF